jgi:hypothetical protein
MRNKFTLSELHQFLIPHNINSQAVFQIAAAQKRLQIVGFKKDGTIVSKMSSEKEFSTELNKLAQEAKVASTVLDWSITKQIYKFDIDLLEMLEGSDNIVLPKDTLSHLPTKCFYVKFGDDDDGVEDMNGEKIAGIFIDVNRVNNAWYIAMQCVVYDKNDNAVLPPFLDFYFMDDEISIDNNFTNVRKLMKDVEETYPEIGFKFIDHDTSCVEAQESFANWVMLALQILVFMSTTTFEENIEKSSDLVIVDKTHYAKTNKKVSEKVRTTDVGFRIGSAFREYKKSMESASSGTGSSKCPHYRRAHYHSFWYGKKDGERVKRVKWISGIFVNAKSGDDIDATIHNVK